MENLNAEQIIRAFECCHSILLGCSDCPFINDSQACAASDRSALEVLKSQEQRIGELAKENESLKTQRRVLAVGLKDLRKEIKAIKADTVRKMQERLEELYTDKLITDDMTVSIGVIKQNIKDIAKEMVEDEK